MSDPGIDPETEPDNARPKRSAGTDEAARRRRRAAVFGEVLPESTSDERADWGDRGASGSEDWLRSQVPPHHG
ncbi:MAG TPA: hypothetical protein VFV40_08705 [Nocardioides sp.]|nr:hypothetical protein [Nocardioides sp.]